MGKGKDKDKEKHDNGDEDGGADADPPNFYCRRNPTIPRQSQPKPYAFLQRILAEHDIDLYGFADPADPNAAPSSTPATAAIGGEAGVEGTAFGSAVDTADSSALRVGAGAVTAAQKGFDVRQATRTLADNSLASSATTTTSNSTAPESSASHAASASASSARPTIGAAPTGGTTEPAASTQTETPPKNDAEELPWFSQLSAYPQLRSAGIPLLPDDAPQSKFASSALANAAKKRAAGATLFASASASSMGAISGSSRPGSASSAMLPPSAASSRITSPRDALGATMESFPSNAQHYSNGSPASPPSGARDFRSTGLSIPLTSTMSSTGSVSSITGMLGESAASTSATRPTTASSLLGSTPMTAASTNCTSTSTHTGSGFINPAAAATNPASLSSGPSIAANSTQIQPQPAQPDAFQEELLPPDNFAMVNSYVYRSSFPKKKHFPFLRTLGLRSVLTLILEEYPTANSTFLDQNGITFFQFGIPGNKEPFVSIPTDKITAALTTILDRRNHPILIHCNKGKHRTGCLIGCLRKLQQWSLTTIFDEYRRFSWPKSRSMDQEFIELYDERAVWRDIDTRFLPKWSVLPITSLYLNRRLPPASASITFSSTTTTTNNSHSHSHSQTRLPTINESAHHLPGNQGTASFVTGTHSQSLVEDTLHRNPDPNDANADADADDDIDPDESPDFDSMSTWRGM